MSETTQALDWESKFRAGTTPWERPDANPAFLAWRASAVLMPGRILVPGAGRSVEPKLLAESGFHVTVVDAAESAVDWQRERLRDSGAVVERADLFAWTAEAPFDAVYDQTLLCALPPPSWKDYATRVREWLRRDGVLAILFMQTGRDGGPPFHCDLATMRGLFDSEHWEWPDALPAPVAHPSGWSEQPAVLIRR